MTTTDVDKQSADDEACGRLLRELLTTGNRFGSSRMNDGQYRAWSTCGFTRIESTSEGASLLAALQDLAEKLT